jgi:type IV pilus assembly protein PilW
MEPAERNKGNPRSGFSLVELLVAMAIAGVVMAAVFKIYTTQQDSYVLQEQVAEMQQNGRTAKYVMTREIRMAGYDPIGTANAGFESAAGDSVSFSMDITPEDDPDGAIILPGDLITYKVEDEILKRDEGSNQFIDVAENIEAIGFGYAFDNNDDGNIDTHPVEGYIIWAFDSNDDDTLDKNLDTNDDGVIDAADDKDGADLPVAVAPTGEVALDKIRAVKIWILARTGREDRAFSDTSTYVVGKQRVPANDGSRRHLLTTTVKCRNMAL